MGTLAWLFFISLFVCSFIAFFRPIPQLYLTTKKRAALGFIVSLWVFPILLIATLPDTPDDPPTYVTEPSSLARVVEKHVHHVIGDMKTRKGENFPSVIKVSIGRRCLISYRSTASGRQGIMHGASEISERVFSDSLCNEIPEILFRPHSMLIDKYGQEEETWVGELIMTRGTAAKVDWYIVRYTDGMLETLFESEGGFWLHGAFDEEGN